jgi:hypothetical protein
VLSLSHKQYFEDNLLIKALKELHLLKKRVIKLYLNKKVKSDCGVKYTDWFSIITKVGVVLVS